MDEHPFDGPWTPPPPPSPVGISACLERMEPGPAMAGLLASIDPEELTEHDKVAVLQASRRMASHYRAREYAAMAAIESTYDALMGDDAELVFTGAATEIRAALRLTRRTAERELNFALDLRRRLPRAWHALANGDIDGPRAKVIVDGTHHLPEDTAREVVDRVIDEAGGWTTGQLRARLARVCIEAEPAEAEVRYETAVAKRRVWSELTVDGTANLYALDLPPDQAAAIMERLNRHARHLHGGDEPRTMDQLRTDVFVDLTLGTVADGDGRRPDRGVVDLQVDLATLAGLSQAPGGLAGYGPVVADVARRVAEEHLDAEWRYTVTDPDTGEIRLVGLTRRRPTARMRRHIEARDRTCRFPGCRHPAVGSDIDHTIPHSAGGPTSEANGAPLCRPDHCVRHQVGWHYVRRPDGDYLWTSPLGRTYTTSGRDP